MSDSHAKFLNSAVAIENSGKPIGCRAISDAMEKALLNVLANTEPFEVIDARTGKTYRYNAKSPEKLKLR